MLAALAAACVGDTTDISPQPQVVERPCADGYETCDGVCVAVQVDPDYCGGCGVACDRGEVCSAGRCGLSCGTGTKRCEDVCVDIRNDPLHCGDCDQACGDDEVCSAGSCRPTCPAPNQWCGDVCTDITSDPANCGGCDNVCTGVAACAAGACSTVSRPDCQAILSDFPSSPDGVYSIDPDGLGGEPPFAVYCDMATDGGGWTLAARFANSDADGWMFDSGFRWYDKLDELGQPTVRSENADMLSRAFWSVPASELKITRSDNNDDAHLLMTDANCLAGQTFRAFITGFGNFRNGAPWATNNALGTCSVSLGSNYAATEGFARAKCVGTVGAANTISFWAHAGGSVGNAAVMMIGGGGNNCGGADHGIGVTGANQSGFNTVTQGFNETDFGNASAPQGIADYALNLFVR